MKLRTVLGELGVTDFESGSGVNLDGEVIVFPRNEFSSPIPEQLVLAAEGDSVNTESFPGLTLIYCGPGPLDDSCRPAPRTIRIACDLSRDELQQKFVHLPELHIYLDLQRKRIFSAFQSSYDIQHYADRIFEVMGNPLMVVNSDRRLLASSGSFPENREDVLEEINQGYVLEEVDAEMERAGILDDVRHAGHSIISENERFGQRWVTSIITYHHMEMGRFDMLEQDRVVRDSDLELIDFAGSLAGIMIDRLGIAGERAGSGSTVLDDLLNATFANDKTMRAQLALSSMPLDDTYVFVELVGEREIPRAHLQRMASRVSGAFRNSLWTIRDGTLVVLVALGPRTCSGWDCYDRAERILGQRKRLISTLERNGLRAYVSDPFEQIGLAPERHQQVRDLLNAHVDDDGLIVYFWHHRYAVLASLCNTFGQVDMMLDKRVIAMSMYDQDHGTAYLETAFQTVHYPGSPAEAAKALNVHRNTYFYRVNKIQELFYLDLRSGEDRLAVAFYIRYLEGMDNRLMINVDSMPLSWRRAVRRHVVR